MATPTPTMQHSADVDGDAAVATFTTAGATSTTAEEDAYDSGPEVTVAQDTPEYISEIFSSKGRDARWVRGLSLEDEIYEEETRRRRRRAAHRRGWEDLDDSPMDSNAKGTTFVKVRHWLRRPNLLCGFYLVLLLLRAATGLRQSYRMDYPSSTRQLELFARRYGENSTSFFFRALVPLAFPHAIGAAYTLLLSFVIGAASHSFIALCGVGLSILSLLALVSQGTILLASCELSSISNRWECSAPLTFYNVCTVMRVLCPLLAIWCCAPVFDAARRCGAQWRTTLAVPCILAAATTAKSIADGKPHLVLLDVTHVSVILTWGIFWRSCWSQPPFQAVLPPLKLHED